MAEEQPQSNGPDSGPERAKFPVRPRVIVIAVALALPVAFGLNMIMPMELDKTHHVDVPLLRDNLSGSFNGDGPINKTPEGVAVKGYDVVAYFTEEAAIKGSEEFTATYQDATFQFASEENRQRFLDDPEQYIPAYGGYCALGVANGYKDDMHPEAFDIVDGALYFNLTPSIGEHWAERKDQYIRSANENWPSLRDAPGYGPMDAR